MSLEDCLNRAVEGGEADAARAELVRKQYLKLEADYVAKGMAPEDASAQAALDVASAESREIVARRYATLKQLNRNQRNSASILNHRNRKGELDPADGLRQLLEDQGTASFGNVVNEEGVLISRYNNLIRGLLEQHGLSATGKVRNEAKLGDLVRELSGEATGNVNAKELADAVREAMEMARRDFNAAGGNIGMMEGYDLPHSHSRDKILRTAKDEWITALRDNHLDWTRIENPKTLMPFSDDPVLTPQAKAEATAFLDEIHDAIRTDNWSRKEPGMIAGSGSMRSRRAHPRTLHFKSADDWIAYNRSYGDADPFTALMNHLQGMARDTALMRVLGPNPKGGLTFAQQTAEKAIKTRDYVDPKTGIENAKARARDERWLGVAKSSSSNMLAQLDGTASIPGDPEIARFMAGTRQVLTSVQLGSATLSAVSDYGTIGLQAAEFGGSGTRAVAQAVALLNPLNKADRELAARAGLVLDHLTSTTNAAARFTGDMAGSAVVERLPHATMRLSGLAQLTTINRHAIQLEFMGVLADNRHLGFDEIHPYLQDKLARRDVTPEEWDVIRQIKPIHKTGSSRGLIVPDHIRTSDLLDEDAAEALATKMHALMLQQQELAVPSASVRGRAAMVGTTEAGSWVGELARSGSMYKSFALSIFFNQLLGRVNRLPPGRRGKELAKFAAVSTILGGVAIQLKEIAKGRDPQPMNRADFWMRAGFQGGGLGILGDFVTAEQNRMGGGLPGTLAGPVVGTAGDFIGVPVRALTAAVKGEDVNLGREVSGLIRRNTPIASSLWWMRAGYDRVFMDTLQEVLDPEAQQAWNRADKRRRNEYGNDAWWTSGSPTPDRLPEFSNVIEE